MKAYELLINTARFYGEDTNRRSKDPINVNACRYIGLGGHRCALGRYLPDETCIELDKGLGTPASEIEFDVLDDTKLEGIHPHDLESIQEFHDQDFYWDLVEERGLSEEGERKFKELALELSGVPRFQQLAIRFREDENELDDHCGLCGSPSITIINEHGTPLCGECVES